MITTAPDHITIRQSASATLAWLFEVDGEPIDFTTYGGARMQVRDKQDQASTLVVSVTSDDLIDLAADGTITATLDEDTLADVAPGCYSWDLRLVDADGNVDYPPTRLTKTAREMVPVPQIRNARVIGDRGGHG